MSSEILFTHIVQWNKGEYQVVINEQELFLFNPKNNLAEIQLAHKDLLGIKFLSDEDRIESISPQLPADQEPLLSDGDESRVVLYYYSYLKSNSWFSSTKENSRERKEINLHFQNFNLAKLIQFKQAFPKDIIEPPKKKFLVFLNPVSGAGYSLKMWETKILPILKESNFISYDLHFSEYPGHIRHLMLEDENHPEIRKRNPKQKKLLTPLSQYTTIVGIGGDGTYWEVINGILERKQQDGLQILSNISIQPLPTGSGNALNKSILFGNNETPILINALFNLIRGKSFPKDLSTIQYLSPSAKGLHPTKVSSFLLVGYGILADLDIYSEHLHFLGELRFYIYALYYSLIKRYYSATLCMKLISSDSFSSAAPNTLEKLRSSHPSFLLERFKQMKDGNTDNNDDNQNLWITIDSNRFSFIAAVLISHVSETVYFAPNKKLNSNQITIILGEGLSRLQLLEILIKADTGEHLKIPGVHCFECSEYLLFPKGNKNLNISNIPIDYDQQQQSNDEKYGIYSIDGERFPAKPIEGILLPNGSRLLSLQTFS
jgi:diacylglycerol kinase family enzyme